MNNLIAAYTSAWKKSFDYSSRSTRGEYWWYVLANFLVLLVVNLLPLAHSLFYNPAILYMLAQLVPSISIVIRRLRDAGKSWPWFFIQLVPLFGGIWLIYLLVQPSVGPLA